MTEHPVDLLIIGAGPYGLAAAAAARARGLSVRVHGHLLNLLGAPYAARHGAPIRPRLAHRSARAASFEAFAEERALPTQQLHPLALDVFRDYVRWFVDRSELDVDARYIRSPEIGQPLALHRHTRRRLHR